MYNSGRATSFHSGSPAGRATSFHSGSPAGGSHYGNHYPGGYEADGCCSGGNNDGNLSYVGPGQGGWIQEMSYRYIGSGGDFDMIRRRHGGVPPWLCCLIPSLCLLPLLFAWLCQPSIEAFDCDADFDLWEAAWSSEKREYCCDRAGRGCGPVMTALPATSPTVPPTPLPTTRPAQPQGPVDPFNCAVGLAAQWQKEKKDWCCKIHHLGCPPTVPPTQPPAPPPTAPAVPPADLPPADPYNCAEGYANWNAGWSLPKKEWCCKVHGKGCVVPGEGGGCVTTSPLFDCVAGFANWQQGWSIPKKSWCCQNQGKGCPPAQPGC